ncbi:hypothetical protein SO802_001358 [Lithocarpus litseifolius]|uniref:Reverse transcriptase domain-containing protein n=1 Tax=Lithocarpus litseifolius TaxID=425828 RepID=A0AAW2DXY4_9ROSI
MQDLKAPGPDDFPVIFYKQMWPTVGDDVVRAVTSFFHLGAMPKDVNSSLIVLIPKTSNPSTVNHYRPISLCNVVYKVISKLLVSKLKTLLDKIISPAQSTFIPNRWIAKNQVIVQEVLHSFKTRKTKPGLMAVKLDLQKAGLRQGDPLSSYLFILGQEVLSRLLDHELRCRNIDGIKTSIGGPTITHVMYMDDIILFSKASNKNAVNLERDGKFLAWKSWEKLCLPKGAGGLGFKKTKDINNALLAKLAWMIASNRESLCMTILRAKYKFKGDWLRSDLTKVASPIWRAIESTKSLVAKGACYLVGDDTSINIWNDPWVPWLQGFISKPKSPTLPNLPTQGSSLINHDLHCWKPHIINEVFEPQSAQAVLSIPNPITPRVDKLCWILESKGVFTVKSAYKASLPQVPTHSTPLVDWKKIWKLNTLQRIKLFLWRLGSNVLPTKENILRWLDIPDTLYVLCKKELESLHHLFFKCNIARDLWFAACWGFKVEHSLTTSPEFFTNLVLNPPIASSQT